MKRVLLVSEKEIKALSIMETNVDGKLLSKVILNTQENQLKPILGRTLFDSVVDEVELTATDPAHTMDEAIASLLAYIKPYLTYAVIVDFLVINNYKLSNKGVQKLGDNSSQAVSIQELESMKNYYENYATTYKRELTDFLRANGYTAGDTNITDPAIGWYMPNSFFFREGAGASVSDPYTYYDEETDPVWLAERVNYYTKGEVDSLLGGATISTAWDDITGKPSTFNPSAHSHAIGEVTNLQTTLDGKASLTHDHDDLYYQKAEVDSLIAGVSPSVAWDDVTGKPTTFDPSAHTHSIADVTGLQTALDGKQATGDYATNSSVVHTTGDESVGGVKTLSRNLIVNSPNGEYALRIKSLGSTSGNDWRFGQGWAGNYDGDLLVSNNTSVKILFGADGSLTTWGGFFVNLPDSSGVTAIRPLSHGNSSIIFESGAGGSTGQHTRVEAWDTLKLRAATGDIGFYAGGGTPLMTMKQNGNFLVGTTTDAGFKLDVNGTGRINGSLAVNTSIISGDASGGINTGSHIYMVGSGSTRSQRAVIFGTAGGSGRLGAIGSGWYTSDLGLEFVTSGTLQGGVTSGGNWLIGTATDSGFKLDVSGTVRISGNATLNSLTGTGTRMVVADASGVLSTQAIPSGGSGGDILSTLLNTVNSITGAATASLSTMNDCSGSSDYTVTVPTAAGNTGKMVGVKVASSFNYVVSVVGTSGQTIDGLSSIALIRNELVILCSDGSSWYMMNRKTTPLSVAMNKTDSVTTAVPYNLTKIGVNTILSDNAGQGDVSNTRIIIKRTGTYMFIQEVWADGNSIDNAQARTHVNGVAENVMSGSIPAYGTLQGTGFLSLNAGDYVELFTWHDSIGSKNFYGGQLTLTEIK